MITERPNAALIVARKVSATLASRRLELGVFDYHLENCGRGLCSFVVGSRKTVLSLF